MTATIEPEADEKDLDRPSVDATTVRRVLWFAAVILVLLLVRSFVVEPVRVRSDSMEPTLPAGAVLLIDKVTYLAREPHRGEVIVTTDPRTGEMIVKRVVAIGGDSVGIDDGLLVVDGARVVESYIDNDNMEGFFFGPDVVPAGHVFLLGDNRDTSADSRAFGPVAIEAVDGRVLVTIWPLG
ncbi:MAG: signal peptidase I [Actinomycetota bacterium]|nr:signal peptidase I [Actinomycetota bacterium]